MDLATDILKLTEKVSQVPGLSSACSIAIQIINTVQIAKNNKARLRCLAHSVVDHLVIIAERMDGKWDSATDNLKSHLDGFEAALQDLSKLVKKCSKTSPVLAFVNAGDRQMTIQRLEQRLADAKTSVLIQLGIDAALSLQNIETGVNRFTNVLESQTFSTQSQLQNVGSSVNQVHVSLRSQGSRIEDTYSTVVRLEDVMRGQAAQIQSKQTVQDTDLPVYSRHELRLQQTISRSHRGSKVAGSHMTITLQKARHRKDGQVVLVKSYEGSRPQTAFSRDLLFYKSVWNSVFLQIVGVSDHAVSIPFQVFDAPEGQVENFGSWLNRTLVSNPVETICGLYAMRTSIKALLEFRTSHDVACRLLFQNSVVNVQIEENRPSWALIFSGEIESRHWSWTVHDEYRFMSSLLGPDAPAWSVVDAFGRGSRSWADDGAHDLDALFNQGFHNLNLTTLNSALFENGRLGSCFHLIPASALVGLGDVGYMAGNDQFIVVSNLYSLLTSVDGSPLAWEPSIHHYSKPSPEDTVGVGSDKRCDGVKDSWCNYTLHYVNLDQRHAWSVLQKNAWKIIASHGLSILPHDLKLVTRITQHSFFPAQSLADSEEGAVAEQSSPVKTFSRRSDTNSLEIARLAIQDISDVAAQSDMATGLTADTTGRRASTSASDSPRPQPIDQHNSVEIFEGEEIRVRETGVPELSPWAQAFQREPVLLEEDNPFWVYEEQLPLGMRRLENVGGYNLDDARCRIDFIQLPPGVALPHVEEVTDV